MRAAVFHKAGEPLRLETVPDPEPGDDDVILAVSGAGICGSDLHVTETPGLVAPGSILGHEFAGTIVATGRDAVAAGWRVGDRVTALPVYPCRRCDACDAGLPALCPTGIFSGFAPGKEGAYAQFVRARTDKLQRVPAGIDDSVAAMIEPLAVAHHTVARAEIRPDDRVLVLGGGPIGAAAALFARAGGARTVVVSEPSPLRRERCTMLGATATIDPTSEDVASRFAQIAGGPPSVILECVGIAGMLASAVQMAGVRGRIVVAGVLFADDTFSPLAAFAREVSIVYSQAYNEADFAAVIDALARQEIDAKPLLTQVIGFDAFPATFEALRRNPAQCKVVLNPELLSN